AGLGDLVAGQADLLQQFTDEPGVARVIFDQQQIDWRVDHGQERDPSISAPLLQACHKYLPGQYFAQAGFPRGCNSVLLGTTSDVPTPFPRSEEHTSELQSRLHL